MFPVIFQPDDGQGDTGSLGNQPGAYFFTGKFFIGIVLFLYIQKFSRGFYVGETLHLLSSSGKFHLLSFAKINPS